jgi:hypothetical protein
MIIRGVTGMATHLNNSVVSTETTKKMITILNNNFKSLLRRNTIPDANLFVILMAGR